MVDWEYYCKRRRIQLPLLIVKRNIESYDHMVSWCQEEGTEPPEQGEFQSAYAVAFPPIEAPVIPKIIEEKIISKPIKRKRGRPRKIKEPIKSWGEHEGISWVARKRGPQSDTHRWIVVINNEAIGYYKTFADAVKAYEDKTNDKR